LAFGVPDAFYFLAATTALLISRRKPVETSEIDIDLIKVSSLCFSITPLAGALIPLQHYLIYS
jgi:hypothetical protein